MGPSTEVGSLHYDLNIDDSKLKGQLNSADKSVQSFGDRISASWDKSVAASKQLLVGVAAVGAATVAFGVTSVKAFEDSENRIAQTNAVLKSTGGIAGVTADQVTKLATALERQTKFSDEDVRSVENLLLTFTSITKDIFPQATKITLDMATALGEDTRSAAIQLGKALQDPVLGVTALRRVGVNFNQAQQEVIKNLVDTGHTAQAQQLIMKELTREFGGSAVAAGGTFSGSLAKLKNQFNNLQEAVGKIIIEAITPLADKFAVLVDKINASGGLFEYLHGVFQRNKGAIIAIAGAIAGGLVPALASMAISLATNLLYLAPFMAIGAALFYLWNRNKLLFYALTGALIGFAIGMVIFMLPAIGAATSAFIGMAVAVIAATWPFVLAGVLIAGAAYLIIHYWSDLKQWFRDFLQWLHGTTGAKVVAILAALFPFISLPILIKTHWHELTAFFKRIWSDITGTFSEAVGLIVAFWQASVAEFKSVVDDIWKVIRPPLELLKNIFIVVFGSILLVVLTVLNFLKNILITAFNFWYGVVSTAMQAIWNVIYPIWMTIYNFILMLGQDLFRGVAFVWNLIYDHISNAMAVIFNVVSTIWNAIYGVFSTVIGAIINFFTPFFNMLYQTGRNIVGGLINGLQSLAGGVWTAIKFVGDKIGDFFSGAGHWLWDVGRAIVGGLVEGIKSAVSWINDAAGKISNAVQSKVKNLLGIKSPSKVFEGIGRNVSEGFARGISGAQHLATKAVSNLSASVIAPSISVTQTGRSASQPVGNTIMINTINDKSDADYILRRIDSNNSLQGMGLSAT